MSALQSNKDWVRVAHTPGKIERLEAYFSGYGYEPHRHDTYAIGRTLSGVQSFRYRDSKQHSLPGGTIVCSGQQKLAAALEFFQNNSSDSFGVKPPLY